MKAFLLAAGIGSRLRPLTDRMPKCMVPIQGKPLLDIWLDALADAGADEVLVNLHHLPHMVEEHLARRTGPPRAAIRLEPTLLGSAGTLVANRGWVQDEDAVLVCNADNLTDFDVRTLLEAHRRGGQVATIALFRAERPSECGIVEVDGDGRVTAFSEKPAVPTSDLANAGMYAFDPCLFDELVGPPPMDIGYHLLPRLVGRAGTITVPGYFRDIGTPEALERAQDEWSSLSTHHEGARP